MHSLYQFIGVFVMVAIPKPINRTIDAVYRKYEERGDDGLRAHLGASIIGRKCDRQKWYTFHWITRANFPGRVRRLFKRGNDAEANFSEELRSVGVEVIDLDPDTGKQIEVRDETGHFGGSCDGAGLGIHEAPKTWHVLEYKTHNDKSFKLLCKLGVQKAKPEHWVQMQIYMHFMGLERAFYMAENKNDSELYQERVYYDVAAALGFVARAKRIIESAEPLEKISDDPSWHECRFCDHHETCHGTRIPERNCRTCLHSSPITSGEDKGKWYCHQYKIFLDTDRQKRGCGDGHRYIPSLIPGEQTNAAEDGAWIQYKMRDGSAWIDEGRQGDK